MLFSFICFSGDIIIISFMVCPLAQTTLQIPELRDDLNYYNYQESIDMGVTAEIQDKKVATRILQKLKRKLDTKFPIGRQTISDTKWRKISAEYPLKVNIFNAKKNIRNKLKLRTTNNQKYYV